MRLAPRGGTRQTNFANGPRDHSRRASQVCTKWAGPANMQIRTRPSNRFPGSALSACGPQLRCVMLMMEARKSGRLPTMAIAIAGPRPGTGGGSKGGHFSSGSGRGGRGTALAESTGCCGSKVLGARERPVEVASLALHGFPVEDSDHSRLPHLTGCVAAELV